MIGETFYSTIADARVKFEVVKSRGEGIYECVAKDNPYGEYDGTVMHKSIEELEGIIAQRKEFEKSDRRANQYISNLNIGDIVHYHHGFGVYVQCEVVESDEYGNGNWSKHGIALKKMALLGNVKGYDLPKVIDGEVHVPYLAKHVLNHSLFTPHPSTIYEYQPEGKKCNPYKLKEVEIEIPELTNEDKRIAEIDEAFAEAMELMHEPSEENLSAAIEILQAVQ